jgi:transposase
MTQPDTSCPEIAAWIGLDWADQFHVICLEPTAGGDRETATLQQSPEALDQWAQQLRQRFEGRRVAIALEQSRGAIAYALLKYDFLILYPVNPLAFSQYRKSFKPSGAKSDSADAALLLNFLLERRGELRPLQPDDPLTRSLRLLTEGRRQLVDQSTALTNQLTDQLKKCFPQALAWLGKLDSLPACDLLEQWPTLQDLQKVKPKALLRWFQQRHHRHLDHLKTWMAEIQQAQPLTTDTALLLSSSLMVRALVRQLRQLVLAIQEYDRQIKQLYEQHPDHDLYKSLPGAGPALGPRLLSALGSDRGRFQCAAEIQSLAGIAPVTESSGKTCYVHWRTSCPKFLRQTFHEFAAQSIHFSAWAKAYYQQQRAKGAHYYAAVRALAFKWIRIIFRCWKNRTPYNESFYLQALALRGSQLVAKLEKPSPQSFCGKSVSTL